MLADESALKMAKPSGRPSGAGSAPPPGKHPIVVFLKGNITPWWFGGTVFVIYFLFELGFPRIETDSMTMAVHIPFAFLFVLGCAWNLFHTPNHGVSYRSIHKWVGRFAMLIGFLSVFTGYAYVLGGESTLPLGTKVLMMTIGFIQIALQLLGIWYVKGPRKWIRMHMSMMTYLYYNSGVLIAVNWIPKLITGHLLPGTAQTNWTFVSMLLGLCIAHIAVRYNKKHMDLDDD